MSSNTSIDITERVRLMSRNEIYSKLLTWFGDGTFITTDGLSQAQIERESHLRKISYTPITRILFVGDSKDNPEFQEFLALVTTGRILGPLGMKVKKDLRTIYGLQKATKKEEIMRFDYKNAIIYID